MKHTLKFHPNGKFRILMVSDIQEAVEYDERTVPALRKLIAETNPDLVIWGGDNCDGRYLKTREELDNYLKIFTAPMEEKQIPWMHVYGNHDYDVDVPAAEQHDMYQAYPYCISGRSPEGVPGVSNYAVPILAHDSYHVAYCVYAFDTMHKNPELRPGVTTDDLLIPNRPKSFRKWDIVRFEQLMWYWNTSKQLEAQEGHTVRALAVMHVPPHEMYTCIDNPEETKFKGIHDESFQCGVLNPGLFATMMERGDVDIIAAGHLHRDTFEVEYGGIRMCLDGCGGFSPKSHDDRRGGRIFDICEDGSFETEFIAYQNLVDITKAE